MAKIRILPEILSNKIAAGEVVERPASVIKELLENALDAGADRIMIDVEKGGRSLIQVSDNGCGMGWDDALLAIERYATSKIHQDPDLFSIRTLGFRGEALPSVAAVSRFTMETREKRAAAGTRIEIEGGKLKNVAEVGAPVGTLITVRGLFFNTPARRKFLKTVNTEMGHIGDTVASMALGWPGVGFRLRHNDRPVKAWTAVSDPAERTADILGRELRKDLHPVESETEAATLTGWIAAPRHTRSTSRSIYLYVNGRY
ncbi:MAG: DNA mismatch repair endonuclease MutL, partial [Thermodesulfobacteriota bacterium]